jgi:hypothetical protein
MKLNNINQLVSHALELETLKVNEWLIEIILNPIHLNVVKLAEKENLNLGYLI